MSLLLPGDKVDLYPWGNAAAQKANGLRKPAVVTSRDCKGARCPLEMLLGEYGPTIYLFIYLFTKFSSGSLFYCLSSGHEYDSP